MKWESGKAMTIGLLRGTGYGLGAHASKYAQEDRTMLRVLRDQALSRPDHPWLICDQVDQLSFGQGWNLVNQIGNALRMSVGVGAHVALLMQNQIEFMPAFYGAQVNHGVVVPLNAQSRGSHLEYVILKSDSVVLIVRDSLFERIEELESIGAVKLIVVVGSAPRVESLHEARVVGWADWLKDSKNTEFGELPSWTDSAVIQFTSGTTGRSKGVLFSHHYLYMSSAVVADSLERTPQDILFTPMPLFHVGALHFVANSSIHAGCTAHLVSSFSPTKYWDQVAASGATFSIILGPMAALVDKVTQIVPKHALQTIFCVPPPPNCAAFEAKFGIEVLWQGYGMTEVHAMPGRRHLLAGNIPGMLGKPVDWVDFGVVDEHDNLLAPNEVGELVFRSLLPHAMISEYYKEPEITVRAFRNFMFHTGDLASYDEQGIVYFKGRQQDRIRRRGEMVGAIEVESVVLTHPEIMEAAVYPVPSEFGEDDIKLDFVSEGEMDLHALREWCEKALPKYMVPRYFEQRLSFPKTPSERIEKYRIREDLLDRNNVFDAEGNRK